MNRLIKRKETSAYHHLRRYCSILCLILCACFLQTAQSCKKETPREKAEKKAKDLGYPVYGEFDPKEQKTPPAFTQEKDDSIKTILNAYYQKIWEDGNLSGQFLVTDGDNILIEKYRGDARINPPVTNSPNTPLHVASISKTVTALAVLKLAEAKKLQLTDTVQKYLPEFPYPNITIENLLSHRSGLPKYEYLIPKLKDAPEKSKEFLTNTDILHILQREKPELMRPAGSGFAYCNTNFVMLALIIEKVTRTPYPQVIKNMIFDPIGMTHSYIFEKKHIPTYAESYYQKKKEAFPLDQYDLLYGDKNLYTTVQDMYRLSLAMFQKDFLSENLLEKAFTPYSNEKAGIKNYGYGFRLKVYDDGSKIIYHTGWWHGSNTIFIHQPKSKLTIVALGNVYSKKIYTAMSLVSLFEKFPDQQEALGKILQNISHPEEEMSAE